MPNSDLTANVSAYLTVGELASYLHVSRRQILKQIQAGALEAVRLGPRIHRIHVEAARDFERRSRVGSDSFGSGAMEGPALAAGGSRRPAVRSPRRPFRVG